MNAKRIAIIGPPGTGKTTRLVRMYNEDFRDFNTLFITFTTTARDVLRERGVENAHTLHSFVTKKLIEGKVIRASQVLPNSFERFVMSAGYGFDFADVNSDHPSNVALRRYSYYFNKHPDKDTSEILKIAEGQEKGAVFERLKAYVEYVEKNNIVDYVSVLRIALDDFPEPAPEDFPVDVIIVDEAQDLSQLQYEVIEKIVEKLEPKIVVMAGDYNQAIYDFQGADYRIFKSFVDEADEVITLSQSYRLPKKPHRFSQFITARLGTKVDFDARSEEGKLSIVKLPKTAIQKQSAQLLNIIEKTISENMDKKIFILTRTNKQTRDLEKKLYEMGYGTHRIKNAVSWFEVNESARVLVEEGVFTEEIVKYVLSNNSKLSRMVSRYMDIKRLVEDLNNENKRGADLDTLRDEIRTFGETLPKSKALDLDLYLDTMHASKGEEADVVVVIDYVNARIEKQIKKSKESLEAEARVLYVASTRVRESLTVITTDSNRSILRYLKW